MKAFLALASALLMAIDMHAQGINVSGKITGPDGGIPNVSVRELSGEHRVVSNTRADGNGIFTFKVRDTQHWLQFYAPGYRTLTHKMLGHTSFNVTMEPRRKSPYLGHEKVLLRTKDMLCGHYMGESIPVRTWVEQLSDTIFAIVIPVEMKLKVDEYPAGRMLLVLTQYDEQIMQWENIADVYPLQGDPDEMYDAKLTQSYNGIDKSPGGTDEEENLYCYPHFQFTLSQLRYLIDNPERWDRMVVDTYRADNYWNFYPTAKTRDLLQKVIDKAGKRK